MIYIENNSTDPYFNFALEDYLIHEKNLPTDQIFMFWRTVPTLMIGKYQNTIEEINTVFAKENDIKVVRRPSGGGTIYTDMGGWQFSFITRGQAESIDFKKYIEPVIEALKKLAVPAEFNSRNDLVIRGKKFSGNAQCMQNGYTLHHGSLLFQTDFEQMVKCLTVDDYKIISKGIQSVKERVTNISEHLREPMDSGTFKQLMVESIMQGEKDVYVLTNEDFKRIQAIAKEKFETWEWNYGKSPKFNITKIGRFDGGKMEFKLDVNKGKITDCNIYGDFFGSMDVSVLIQALIGKRYEKESVKKAIEQCNIKDGFYRIDVNELADTICE